MNKEQWKLVEEVAEQEWNEVRAKRREEAEKADKELLAKGPHTKVVKQLEAALGAANKHSATLEKMGIAIRYGGYRPSNFNPGTPEFTDFGPNRKAYDQWHAEKAKEMRKIIVEAKLNPAGIEAKSLLEMLRKVMNG